MKAPLHPALALTVAALGGCAIFVLLLPWGDPCFHPDEPCHFSAAQNNFGNAVFLLICLAVSFGAGWLSRSYRLLAGTLSVPLASALGAVLARVVYNIERPLFNSGVPDAAVMALLYLGGLLLLGAIGAVASMWLRRPSSAPSFKPRPPSGS